MKFEWLTRDNRLMYVTEPAAKMMELFILENSKYQASCLSATWAFEAKSLDEAKKLAEKWFVTRIRILYHALLGSICDARDQDFGPCGAD